jgi:iron complex outermembrane receptor protein
MAAVCLPFAAAQNGPVADLTGMSLEDLSQVRLSTASRHLEDPRKAPTAMTVISAEEISRYGWRTLADLLRSVTGFYTAYDRTYTYAGVRGFLQSGDYNARILLLVDGHRINDNIYDGGLIGTEFPLDLSLIDRVEILRGPGSSLYGTNAELGVVNVITRTPGHHGSAEFSSDADSFTGRTGELRSSFRTGRVAALASGSMYRSNGHDRLYVPEFDSPATNNGVAVNMDGDRYDHLFGTARMGNLRVQGLFGKRDKIVPNAAYGTVFNDPNHTLDTVGYLEANYSRQTLSNLQLDLRGYYDAYRFWASYPYPASSGAGTTMQINDAVADSVGIEGVLARSVGRNRVVAGLASERSLRLEQRNYYLGQAPYLDDHRSLIHNAVFGEVEINPISKLSFNLGGRNDWFNLFGSDFSPRLAAMYFPTSKTSLKYIFSHAFRAPDAYDQFFEGQDQTPADRAIAPESIDSHTILYERAFAGDVRLAATGFANKLNRVIRENIDAQGNTHFSNQKGDTNRGAELELIANYASGWQGRASYTFAETNDRQSGTRTMNSPGHLAKFNGVAPLGSRAYFGSEFLFTGSQPNYLQQRIGSSFLVNATISSRTFHGFEVSASSYNLLDRRWATPTGPEVAGPASVQDGRTLRFRLTYRHSIEGKPAR